MRNFMSRVTGLTGTRVRRARKLSVLAVVTLLLCWPPPIHVRAAAGDLDNTFGTGGKLVTDTSAEASAVGIQSDGKILVAGTTFTIGHVFTLARYNPDGSLDSAFGDDGLVVNPPSFEEVARALVIQPDGKIVVAGSARTDHGVQGFGLARYDSGVIIGGTQFNTCIQDDSNNPIFKFNSTTGDYQFTNCSGLVTSGTGSVTRRGNITTLQHTAADRRVLASVDTSVNKATAAIQLFSQGTTIAIIDRNTANNTCACR